MTQQQPGLLTRGTGCDRLSVIAKVQTQIVLLISISYNELHHWKKLNMYEHPVMHSELSMSAEQVTPISK